MKRVRSGAAGLRAGGLEQRGPQPTRRRRGDRITGLLAVANGTKQTSQPVCRMSASLIGRLGSSTFRLSTTAMSMSPTGSRFSPESALGPFHHGIRGRGGTIFGSALPSGDGRSKRTCELTSSIVPRGTSFHCRVELGFPPIGFDPVRVSCSCCGLLSGPAELSSVNPDAVHDHGQPAGQRDDRLFHPAAPGDLHCPGLEP